MPQTAKYWIWSLFYALLFIAVYGYAFNSSDLEEHLPLVYKLQNHSLYTGDYVTDYLYTNFSIRYYYAHTLYYLSYIVPLPQLCFGLMVISLTVFCFFYSRLSFLIFKNEWSALISPFVGLILLNKVTVGGNTVFDNMLTCSVFASTLCMTAFYYFFYGKPKLAMLLCGLATLYQPLIGLQVMMLLLLMNIFAQCTNFRETVFGLMAYLIPAVLMLIPLFKKQFFETGSVNDSYYYYILYVFRNPHHYIPSFFSGKDYLMSGILVAVTAFLFTRQPSVFSRQMFFLMTLIMLGMLFYFIVFEEINVMVLGKLQWFKTSVWLTLFCGIYIAHFISLQKPVQLVLGTKIVNYSVPILVIFIFIVITHSAEIPFKKFQSRYHIGDYKKTDLTLLHEWIKDSIPKDKLILSFPEDDSFLCEAQHPTPVAWKAIIHEPWFLKKWHRDFITLYSVRSPVEWKNSDQKKTAEEGYNHHYNLSLMKQYDIAYRLDDINTSTAINQAAIVHRQGHYVLWKTE